MGQANRRGSRETRKALAIQRDQLARAERLKKRQAEWDAMTLEEKVRHRGAEEWLMIALGLVRPYM